MTPPFHWVIGVDQTGRVLRPGKDAPLPAMAVSLLTGEAHALSLLDLSLRTVREHFPSGNLLIAVDCVLGLPGRLTLNLANLWSYLKRAGDRESTLGRGRGAASRFFEEILRDAPDTPLLRASELALGAQSVFREKPYQRNIQTGTFRIWQDLQKGAPRPWFNVWGLGSPQDSTLSDIWLWEGYATAIARSAGTTRERPVSTSPSWLADQKDPDLRDAAWLAFGALSHLLPDGSLSEALWDQVILSRLGSSVQIRLPHGELL